MNLKLTAAIAIAATAGIANADRFQTGDLSRAISGGLLSADRSFSSGFEAPAYSLGDVNGQDGWITTNDGTVFDTFNVVDTFAASGSNSLQSLGGDGNFASKGAFRSFAGLTGGSVSWDWYYDSTTADPFGADQQIIIQSPTVGSVVTRVQRFWSSQTIRVLADDGAGAAVFFDLGFDITGDQWQNFQLDVQPGGAIELFINGSSVFTGQGFTDQIEEVAVFNDNFPGNDFYVDNLNAVPAPGAAALLGAAGIAATRRRR